MLMSPGKLLPGRRPRTGPFHSKWRIMKLTAFLLLVGSLQLSARVSSQTVTLSEKNVPLEKVFADIKNQTGFVVFFDYNLLRDTRPVTVNFTKTPIRDALTQVLKEQDLDFEMDGKSIVIFKRQKPPVTEVTLTATGSVRDVNGNPVVRATVQVKGKPQSVVTDDKGNFSIKAEAGDVLVITSVGFGRREITVRNEEKILIVLQVKDEKLDDVNVVAYGTTTLRDATGSVSVVKGKELAGTPSSNLAGLLQGRVPGMDVTNVSGSPGSGGVATTIRGYNSLDVEQGRRFSNPLWVVDGVPLNAFTSPVTGTNLLSDINPDMIESIQILKDASAAALYGSRAANGVIIVTTKKGAMNQKANFSVNVSQTYSVLPRLPTVTIGSAERNYRLAALLNDPTAYLDPNAQKYIYPTTPIDIYKNPFASLDYFQHGQPATDDGTIFQDSLNSFYNNATNFFPAYYDVGKVSNANIQTYGGARNMSYGMGFGFYNETGVLKGSGFQRLDLNSTMTVSPAERFHVDLRFNASYINRKRGDKTTGLGASPIIETVPGDPYQLSTLFPGEGSSVWNNILDKLSKTREDNRSVRTRANFKLSYDILPGMEVSTLVAGDYAIHRRNHFDPSYLNQSGYSNSIGETGVDLTMLNENLLSYTKQLNDHSIKLLGGMSYEYDRTEYNGGSAQNSPSDYIYYARPGFPLLGTQTSSATLGSTFTQTIAFQQYQSDMQEKALLSYFSRLEYNFQRKYYLTASFRRDGSSVFGQNNRWGTFPSVAAGWTFSEEGFAKRYAPWLNFGKLRASWGKTGMQFSQNYLALGILMAGGISYQGNSVLTPDYGQGLYNDKLSWEETHEVDLGTDISLFNDRLSITSDYYYRFTDKLLLPVRLPGTYNGYLNQWRNAAAISNAGVEVLVNYTVINTPHFAWKFTFNGARNWNRFEKSYNGKDVTSDYALTTANWIIGKPLSGIYALKTDGFITSKDQVPLYYNAGGIGNYLGITNSFYYKPGDYKIVDVNGDGVISSKDAVYMGSALPEISGGIGSDIRWNNFEAKFLFSYQLGRHMVNSMPVTSLSTDVYMHYKHPLLLDLSKATFYDQAGSSAQYVPVQYDNGTYVYNALLDRFVEKVNWMKLKIFTVKYNFPAAIVRRLRMEGMQLFASGENLLTWTNYSGMDPETVSINNGYDDGMNYPLARRFTLGLTFKF